jgi:hypothetical protein
MTPLRFSETGPVMATYAGVCRVADGNKLLAAGAAMVVGVFRYGIPLLAVDGLVAIAADASASESVLEYCAVPALVVACIWFLAMICILLGNGWTLFGRGPLLVANRPWFVGRVLRTAFGARGHAAERWETDRVR